MQYTKKFISSNLIFKNHLLDVVNLAFLIAAALVQMHFLPAPLLLFPKKQKSVQHFDVTVNGQALKSQVCKIKT